VIVMPHSSNPLEQAANIANVRRQMEEQKKKQQAKAKEKAAAKAAKAASKAANVNATRGRTGKSPPVEVVIVTDDDADMSLADGESLLLPSSRVATPQPNNSSFLLPPSSLVVGTPNLPSRAGGPDTPIVFRVAPTDAARKLKPPKGRTKKDSKDGQDMTVKDERPERVTASPSQAAPQIHSNSHYVPSNNFPSSNQPILPALSLLLRQATAGLPGMPPAPLSVSTGIAMRDVEGATASPTSLHAASLPVPPPKPTTHNMVEKRYRDNINDRIRELADVIPIGFQSATFADPRGSSEVSDGDPESPVSYSPDSTGANSAVKKPHKAEILKTAVDYISRLREEAATIRKENERLRIRCAELEEALLSVALGRQPASSVLGGSGGFMGAARAVASPEREDSSGDVVDVGNGRKRKKPSSGSKVSLKEEQQSAATNLGTGTQVGKAQTSTSSSSLPMTATLFSFATLMQLGDWSGIWSSTGQAGPHADTRVFTSDDGLPLSQAEPEPSLLSLLWDGLRILLAIICILHIIVSVLLVPPETRTERLRKRRERASSSTEASALKVMETMQDLPGPSWMAVAGMLVKDGIMLTVDRLFGVKYVRGVVRHVRNGGSERTKGRLTGTKAKGRQIVDESERAIGRPFHATGAYLHSLRARVPSFDGATVTEEDLRVHITAALHLRL
ncbi:hypothetical protein HDU93_003409, partial [Gonapodya sp. JEL0774]